VRCWRRALASLAVAAVAGLALALTTSPVPILAIGALALIAALLYSGGPRPYAGLGLGELMVFLFFGLMATCGTSFVVGGSVTAAAWWSGAALGCWPTRSWSPTTSATSTRTRPPGSERSPSGWAKRRTRLLYRACIVGRLRRHRRRRARVHRRCVGRHDAVVVAGAGLVAARDQADGRGRVGDRPRADPGVDRHGRPRAAFAALLALGLLVERVA
jgi:hypothetical protein